MVCNYNLHSNNDVELQLLYFITDTKIQGTSLEKCSSQIGHDDEDLFKERLKNMGKGISVSVMHFNHMIF